MKSKLKEQKEQILIELDKAILEAPNFHYSGRLTNKMLSKLSEQEQAKFWENQREIDGRDNAEFVFFNAGNCKYKIYNSLENLLTFRKSVKGLDRKIPKARNPLNASIPINTVTQQELNDRAVAELNDRIKGKNDKLSDIEYKIWDSIRDDSNYYRLVNDFDMFRSQKENVQRKIHTKKLQINRGVELGKIATKNFELSQENLLEIDNKITTNRKDFNVLNEKLKVKHDKTLKKDVNYQKLLTEIEEINSRIDKIKRDDWHSEKKIVAKDSNLELEKAKKKRDSLFNDRRGVVAKQINYICFVKHGHNKDRTSLAEELRQDLVLYWLKNSTMLIVEYREEVRRFKARNSVKYRFSFSRYIYSKLMVVFRKKINGYNHILDIPYSLNQKLIRNRKELQAEIPVYHDYWEGHGIGAICDSSCVIDKKPDIEILGSRAYFDIVAKYEVSQNNDIDIELLSSNNDIKVECLSGRDSKVFRLRGQGYKQKEIAKMLNIGIKTIERSCQTINAYAGKYNWIDRKATLLQENGYNDIGVAEFLNVPVCAVK